MESKVPIGDVRGLLLNPDKRPVLRLLPDLDEVSRGYAIKHIGKPGAIARQVWMIKITDWIRKKERLDLMLCRDLNFCGFKRLLHEFALKIAYKHLISCQDLTGEENKSAQSLLDIKRKWLNGEVSKQELSNAKVLYWSTRVDIYSKRSRYTYKPIRAAAADSASFAANRTTLFISMYRGAVKKEALNLLADMLENSAGIDRGVEVKL